MRCISGGLLLYSSMLMEAGGHTQGAEVDTKREWTILSLLEWSTRYLEGHGFDEARLHVELLLSHVLGIPRIGLYTQFDRPLVQEELQGFKSRFRRRLSHEPLQYILGETEFMGVKLFVDPSVLIPRPETEVLVEKVLETLQEIKLDVSEILDIGTGSGNIGIALARALPHARVTGVDISAEALRTAARNVSRHALTNIELAKANVFEEFLPGRRFDVIVSNPPYIALEEFAGLPPEIRTHEPRMATCDESDGYRFLVRITELARSMVRNGGYLFMEIGYNQSEYVTNMLKNSGFAPVDLFHDYSNVPRVIKARQP
jgi:release factor glutamine methyltransferase